jgi:5-methylcytosine-specific restriction protein A
MSYQFLVDKEYSKGDIKEAIGIRSDTKGGNWDTGYVRHKDDYFIFSNIATPGRTGHDYNNQLFGDLLYWEAKEGTKLNQPVIQYLLNPKGLIYFFIRFKNNGLWTYAGTGTHILHSDKNTSPVQIIWNLNANNIKEVCSTIEFNSMPQLFQEGIMRTQLINVYERNPVARKQCVEYWGCKCIICDFDFGKIYGDHGRGFIHVHHVKPLSEIKKSYTIDPKEDLRPVCPNCHTMLHRQTPAITI